MKSLYLLSLCILAWLPVKGQNFSKVYTGDGFTDITPWAVYSLQGGDLLINTIRTVDSTVGTTPVPNNKQILTRTDSLGRIKWTLSLDIRYQRFTFPRFKEIYESRSGRIYLYGDLHAPIIVCLSKAGAVLWVNQLSGLDDVVPSGRLVVAPDEASFYISNMITDAVFALAQVDTNGRLIQADNYTIAGRGYVKFKGMSFLAGLPNIYVFSSLQAPNIYRDATLVAARLDNQGGVLEARNLLLRTIPSHRDFGVCADGLQLGSGGILFYTLPSGPNSGRTPQLIRVPLHHQRAYSYALGARRGIAGVLTDSLIPFSYHQGHKGVMIGGINQQSGPQKYRFFFMDSTGRIGHKGLMTTPASTTPRNFVRHGGNKFRIFDFQNPTPSTGGNASLNVSIAQNAQPVGCFPVDTTHLEYDLDSASFGPGSLQQLPSTTTFDSYPFRYSYLSLCEYDGCAQPRLPSLELGPGITTCLPYKLGAPLLFGSQTVRWSTGQTGVGSDTLIVRTPGIYTLTISGPCGTLVDSIDIRANPSAVSIRPRPLASCPKGEVAVGLQRPVSVSTRIVWTVNRRIVTADPDDSLRLYPTNPTNRDSVVTIGVTAQNGACTGRDSLHITLWPGYPKFLGPDIITCTPDTILARPGFAVDPSWVWHLPSGGTSTDPYVRVRHAGSYAASFSAKGCLYSDTVLVTGNGNENLPNIITLNDDGLNRYLKAECLPAGTMELYNFWGVQVFRQEAYDGLWPPRDTPAGLYFYRFSPVGREGRSGWVEVVR